MSDLPTCVACGRPMLPGDEYRCYPDGRTGYHRLCEELVTAQLVAAARERNGPAPEGRPGAWNVDDIRVVAKGSPEGRELQARHAAGQQRELTAEERAMVEMWGGRGGE